MEKQNKAPLDMVRFDGRIGLKAALSEDERMIDCDAYTGAVVDRWNWELGAYKLQLSIDGCDLSRVEAGAVPLLDNHDSYEGCESVMGKVVTAFKANGKITASARFSKSDPKAQMLWQKIQEGILSSVSVGAMIRRLTDISGENDKIKTFLATDWQLMELSIVGIPADMNAGFSATNPDKLNLSQLAGLSQEQQPEKLSEAGAKAQKEETMADPAITPQPAVTSPPPASAQVLSIDDAQKVATLAVQQERERTGAIRSLSAKLNLPAELADKAITDGMSLDKFREEALNACVDRETKMGEQKTHHAARISVDSRERFREGMEAALTLRVDPKAPRELKEKGQEFAHLRLHEMARVCLEQAGVSTRGVAPERLAELALNPRHEVFAGNHTTSDFPNILANVANKTLRQAYEAAPKTYQPFCRQVTAADFKPINRVQLSDISALDPIKENGEFARGTVSDSKETYSLGTFGKIIAVTRKVIVNDDLSALSRIPAGLGQAAATLESDTVWGVITANAAMADTVALFHASHANLTASNGLAAVANITAARKAMRKQKGPKGTFLNLTPKYLLVPEDLEGIAFQLINPINLAATASSADVPAYVRSMIPIVEPRLGANSATHWYTVCDPSMIDTIEYCYLEGQDGVYVEPRTGYEVDGMEIKARLDFAAAAIDFRGLQKNTA